MSYSHQKANTQINSAHTGMTMHNKSRHSQVAGAGLPLFLQKSNNTTNSSQSKNSSQNRQSPSLLASTIHHARQGGSVLPHYSKQHLESAFGTDLSGVRIHNGIQHNQLASSLNAKAFTVGSDIFFGQGHYKPGTRDGDRLLAHELTHVLQQSAGTVQAKQVEPGVQMGEVNDSHEQEANRAADGLMSANKTLPLAKQNSIYSKQSISSGSSSDIIQRDEEEEQQGFNYNLLPPALSYRYGGFGMSADTSAAQLSYFNNEGRANLGYQYGGDLFYGTDFNGFRSRLGVNPQSGVGSLSFGGSHEGFNFGVGGNTAGNFNLGIGYGAPLLPMPNILGQQAGAAWQGAYAMGGALPDFMSDPMAAYGANRENIGAMGAFGSSLGRIYGQQGQGGLPFGAGLTLSYNPEQRWVFGAGVQGSF